jgi:dienelactone hydrolase
MWDLQKLFETPESHKIDDIHFDGLNAVYIDSIEYQGNSSKFFAWYGIPECAKEIPVPGVVLIPGGGATALADWVKMWNSLGYAAICPDIAAHRPNSLDMDAARYKGWEKHEYSGPEGWGQFAQAEAAYSDQWPYHATAVAILANSFLRAQAGVNKQKIGVTGVSWGGVSTCWATGLDPRFNWAAPVYGCGYLEESGCQLYDLNELDKSLLNQWLKQWDPAKYLNNSQIPALWINGTNDITFPLKSTFRSADLVNAPKCFKIIPEMPHAHGEVSEDIPEIFEFAEIINSNSSLPIKFSDYNLEKNKLKIDFKSERKIFKTKLNFTRAAGTWCDRKWTACKGEVDNNSQTLTATLPYGSTAAFFNTYDENGYIWSSPLIELK